MIPNIVGNFISLLKDTTLVSIIGLFDVLTMLRSIGKDRTWLGLHKEPLVFGAILFFLICFAMSKYSRHLEKNFRLAITIDQISSQGRKYDRNKDAKKH